MRSAGVHRFTATGALPVPRYLERLYWWAYVHPVAVRLFDRAWLVDAILFGNFARLRDAALDALGETISGRTLQVGCVYGNLTQRLRERLTGDAQLDVVDVLPVQLENLGRKLPPDERVALLHGDASSLACAGAQYDRVLLFFLLHEMPENLRRAALGEAVRVLKPGGRLVIVDYHLPSRLHPLRPLMHQVFRHLEPHAFDLWAHRVEQFMPRGAQATFVKRTYFGGLYQRLVWTRQAVSGASGAVERLMNVKREEAPPK
ncbi:MAG: rhodoquinone biosynthesis methyltransferase RquA [Burkholderiaceae bacterium]|nr:rhodoquinone biosynthesis methyltransferase RquA [Burkholderiaceae bacterium]